MKRITILLLITAILWLLAGCSTGAGESIKIITESGSQTESTSGGESSLDIALQNYGAQTNSQNSVEQKEEIITTPLTAGYDADDLDIAENNTEMSEIILDGDTIVFTGSGATVDGSVITITLAGTYGIRGTLNDGQILVDTKDEDAVKLVLNGAEIASSTSAPIYLINAEKTVITLAAGTSNSVTDGSSYVLADEESNEPNAAIFANDDLTINGSGSLTVNANYNNGIASDDDLKITGGDITVIAVNDGIKGKDSVEIKDGVITVEAGGDGIQSSNDGDSEKGYIYIESGTINITAGLDGIQAETSIAIEDGDFTITTGGGSANSSSKGGNWGNWGSNNNTNDADSTDSAKGIKAAIDVTISGGSFKIDSSDDSIHSNNSLTINGGDFILTSGDDGMHSDTSLVINGGKLDITKSYEGIESASITINDGTLAIVSSDDGINIAGGNDGSAMGRPGQNSFSASGSYYLALNGGYITVDAMGDGIDSNGTIDMTGGVVLVNGPTNNGNGALDYMGSFNITGGFLVAAGSSGMAEAPSSTSTQYSVMVNFDSVQPDGTLVHIETQDGQDLLTFMPTKEYQSVGLSSPDIENGSNVVVYTGGSSSGTEVDGLYSGGAYTPGTQVTSMDITSVVTGAGSFGGGFPGGGHGGAPGSGGPGGGGAAGGGAPLDGGALGGGGN